MTKDVFKFLNELKSDIDIAEEIFNDENAINESIDDFLFEETIDELIEEAALTISEDIADDMIIEAVDLSQYRKGGSKEGKLPPHLAKFIDPKTGNFTKDAEARIQKGKKSKASFKDVTPKGYGPKESVELDEKAPKMKGDWLKQERERNNKHDAAMGRTKTGRKKPTRTMTSTQKSLASMRGESVDEAISMKNSINQYYYQDPKGVVQAVGSKDAMRKMNVKQAKDGNKGGSFSMNLKKYKVGDQIKESTEINETISDQKMEMLRKAYSSMPERLSIDQINKLKSVLSKFSKSELEQVKKAKINWLSSMAITLKASTQY